MLHAYAKGFTETMKIFILLSLIVKMISNYTALPLDNRGNVATVNGIYGTSMEKVFAAGGTFYK